MDMGFDGHDIRLPWGYSGRGRQFITEIITTTPIASTELKNYPASRKSTCTYDDIKNSLLLFNHQEDCWHLIHFFGFCKMIYSQNNSYDWRSHLQAVGDAVLSVQDPTLSMASRAGHFLLPLIVIHSFPRCPIFLEEVENLTPG